MARLDRRSFVAALAGSLTAAAASQASGREVVSEHPDLLAMSDRLPDVLRRYRDAANRVRSIEQTWGPQWPTPDPEIFWYASGSETHRDILGRGIETPWGKGGLKRVQSIGTPEVFQASYESHMREADRRSKFKTQRGMKTELNWAESARARIEPARAYWSEVERIKAASGIDDAIDAEKAARNGVRELVGEILTFEERGPIGLGIKAQALAAFIELPSFWQVFNPETPRWLAGLAATLSRQTSPGMT